jgi:hypothetical protein
MPQSSVFSSGDTRLHIYRNAIQRGEKDCRKINIRFHGSIKRSPDKVSYAAFSGIALNHGVVILFG